METLIERIRFLEDEVVTLKIKIEKITSTNNNPETK